MDPHWNTKPLWQLLRRLIDDGGIIFLERAMVLDALIISRARVSILNAESRDLW
jgi:hypothetical protein